MRFYGFIRAGAVVLLFSGCAALFGWDIHAPGALSNGFFYQVQPVQERIALYLEPGTLDYESRLRGSWSADPQTYHIGEAFVPMAIEGFQSGFEEFILLETEPTPELLAHYGIQYLAVVRIKDFGNRVTWKGQALRITTETALLDTAMKRLARFDSEGVSDAEKVFAKKGGPQVNLNAAIENNIMAMVRHIQDSVRAGNWNS